MLVGMEGFELSRALCAPTLQAGTGSISGIIPTSGMPGSNWLPRIGNPRMHHHTHAAYVLAIQFSKQPRELARTGYIISPALQVICLERTNERWQGMPDLNWR